MSKPNLLFVSRKWPPAVGGMETYSYELYSGLLEKYDITLLALPGKPNGRPPSLLSLALFILKITLYCFFRGRKFSKVVFTDTLIFPAALAHALVNPKGNRISVFYGLDLVYANRPGFLPFIYGFVIGFISLVQNVFSKIVAISKSTQMIAVEKGFKNIAIVVPTLPSQGFTSQIPKEFVVPEKYSECKYPIFYFGRLIARKGSLWFAKEVLPSIKQDVLFFVSGNIMDPEYAKELISLPRVVYLGAVPSDQIVNYIRTSSLVVMPNIEIPGGKDKEGFGLVAIEASSVGCRLLASDLEGLSDAVQNGITGYQAPPNQPEAWVQKINEILKQSEADRKKWIESSAKATREIYSPKELIRKFSELLES
ncbi:glycosyltransferase [Leptospira semungkisensis]|uniref:Glycosyltransferase n=1 Tax=Leptospira semungkisensis TaxID=2484985 RepID=A0A4R9G9D5_9LEPT|nr:glycosyltransferase family 4 protein [Leptospira semungkisensis]TGK07885.1 glycosyltransferase [Leptospira semungkisensis]